MFSVSETSWLAVDIQDTDEVREVCSGMFGGKNAYIDGSYKPVSDNLTSYRYLPSSSNIRPDIIRTGRLGHLRVGRRRLPRCGDAR